MLRTGGQSTSMVSGGRRKVHTTFEDGREMVEEYDLRSDELLLRKVRGKTTLGKQGAWDYHVGDEPRIFSAENSTLMESGSNPQFSRLDTDDLFQWRVRNLPYPESTYSVTIDESSNAIVIRTSNRKYFKRFDIPEMIQLRQKLQPEELSWYHRNNALVVSYTKPPEVMQADQLDKMERRKMASQKNEKDGDIDCKQQ